MKYLLLILAFSLGVLLTLWRDNYLLTRDNNAVDSLSRNLNFYEAICDEQCVDSHTKVINNNTYKTREYKDIISGSTATPVQ